MGREKKGRHYANTFSLKRTGILRFGKLARVSDVSKDFKNPNFNASFHFLKLDN